MGRWDCHLEIAYDEAYRSSSRALSKKKLRSARYKGTSTSRDSRIGLTAIKRFYNDCGIHVPFPDSFFFQRTRRISETDILPRSFPGNLDQAGKWLF